MLVVLFYIYTDIEDVTGLQAKFRDFTSRFGITGRLLISKEGVNGTVAQTQDVIAKFQAEFVRLVPAAHGMQWKKSLASKNQKAGTITSSPFIDMKISIVKELVGWGFDREVAGITGAHGSSDNVGHLSPSEFHQKLMRGNASDTVLLDMRNYQESQLGHFRNALLPKAKNMPELGSFLRSQAASVEGKTVLMYCTGGIRCEKASLYLDAVSRGKARHIYQLEGGIHKYLEKFSDSPECQFLGKNFVFDKRGYAGEGIPASNQDPHGAVGMCQSCNVREPHLTGCAVCVVCRFQLLLCTECLPKNGGEHFCFSHKHLSGCYSMFRIPTFSKEELSRRISLLKEKERELLPEGRSGRNRRRTIRKCYTSMEAALANDQSEEGTKRGGEDLAFCRSSGKILSDCKGNCWGFYGQSAVEGWDL